MPHECDYFISKLFFGWMFITYYFEPTCGTGSGIDFGQILNETFYFKVIRHAISGCPRFKIILETLNRLVYSV